MLSLAIGIYTVYILIHIYVSVMQIGYVSQAKSGESVLLPSEEFVKAGNYAISKERINIISTIVEYAVMIFWMSFGIAWLDGQFLSLSPIMHTIFFVLGFVVLNALISLPFEVYQKFVLDEEYGFNKSTPALYIKDTLISKAMMLVIGTLVIWGVGSIMLSFVMWWL